MKSEWLFEQWPNPLWIQRAAEAHKKSKTTPEEIKQGQLLDFDFSTVSELHELISANAQKLLPTDDDAEVRAGAEAKLSDLLGKLRTWKLHLMPGAARNFKQFYTAEQLVYSIDLSLKTKAGSTGLREVCVLALKALFPSINDVVWASMARVSLPSATTVTRHMLTLEVAMLLMKRQLASDTSVPPIRYGLVDASPAWGLDWMWIQEWSLPGGKELVSVFHQSVLWRQAFLSWQAMCPFDLSTIEAHQIPDHLQEQLGRIAGKFSVHTYTPVVIGSGYANLSHKVAACLHAFMLHCGNVDALRRHVETYASWTTDLGTESGFSDYRCHDIANLLPVWMQRPALEHDLENPSEQELETDLAEDIETPDHLCNVHV